VRNRDVFLERSLIFRHGGTHAWGPGVRILDPLNPLSLCQDDINSVMLNEAKTSRPRPMPKLRGRGQSYEAEAWTVRPRPRPKIIMKKYQIMINNI